MTAIYIRPFNEYYDKRGASFGNGMAETLSPGNGCPYALVKIIERDYCHDLEIRHGGWVGQDPGQPACGVKVVGRVTTQWKITVL